MTTATPLTANETLMGLEATARQRYEDAFANRHFAVIEAAAHVDLPSGERIVVGYNALGATSYWYREHEFEALQPVVNRSVALMILGQRLALPA